MSKITRLLGVAATALTGVGVVRRKKMIDAVSPELRNRQLWLPLSLRGPRSLKVGRAMMAKQPLAHHEAPAQRGPFAFPGACSD